MDWGQIGYLFSGLAGLIGVAWTIYMGRKRSKRDETSDLVRDARQVITSYKEMVQQQEAELSNLRKEVAQLRQRIARLERRNRQMKQVLTKEQLLALPEEEVNGNGH